MERGPIRAAIISDTHGVLRPEVERILETCDVIVHAGDFDTQMLYHKLEVNQPLFAVRGNNDRGWSGGLPGIKRFEIEGVKFIMAHERTQIPGSLGDAQVVVFGHSHMYQQQEINGRLWLNPGSCGYKRGTLPLSMAVMTIENGAYTLETIWLEKGYGTPEDAIAKREKPKRKQDMNVSRSVICRRKKDKEMLTKELGAKIDLLNLQGFYRAKKYYHMLAPDIYTLLIPIQHKLSNQEFQRIWSKRHQWKNSKKIK